MKYIPSIAFEEMSGSAKGVTAAKVRGRKYIRNRGYGGGFKTVAQSSVKAIFKQLSQGWKGLTNAQILAWNALANTQKGKSVLGTSSKISGANLYSRLNFWIVKAGGVALTTPPVLTGVDAPCEADLSLTSCLTLRQRRTTSDWSLWHLLRRARASPGLIARLCPSELREPSSMTRSTSWPTTRLCTVKSRKQHRRCS